MDHSPAHPSPIPRPIKPIKLAFPFPALEDAEIREIITGVQGELMPLELDSICWVRNPDKETDLAVLLTAKKQIPVTNKRKGGWKPWVENAFQNFGVIIPEDPTTFTHCVTGFIKRNPARAVKFEV